MFASGSKKERHLAKAQVLADQLWGVLPFLVNLSDDKVPGVKMRGLSVNPAREGGFCAVLRLTLINDSETPSEFVGGWDSGDYVIYGFGPTPLMAIAVIEAQMGEAEASLVPDRFSQESGKMAPINAPKRGRRH